MCVYSTYTYGYIVRLHAERRSLLSSLHILVNICYGLELKSWVKPLQTVLIKAWLKVFLSRQIE